MGWSGKNETLWTVRAGLQFWVFNIIEFIYLFIAEMFMREKSSKTPSEKSRFHKYLTLTFQIIFCFKKFLKLLSEI